MELNYNVLSHFVVKIMLYVVLTDTYLGHAAWCYNVRLFFLVFRYREYMHLRDIMAINRNFLSNL